MTLITAVRETWYYKLVKNIYFLPVWYVQKHVDWRLSNRNLLPKILRCEGEINQVKWKSSYFSKLTKRIADSGEKASSLRFAKSAQAIGSKFLVLSKKIIVSGEENEFLRKPYSWSVSYQAFSQVSKSGCPNCTIGPVQMDNLWSNIWETKQYSLKSGRPKHTWTPIWLKPCLSLASFIQICMFSVLFVIIHRSL